MKDYELLIEFQEQYDSAETTSDLKLLIDTFLENFPIDQSE